jgi:hypothetical protein
MSNNIETIVSILNKYEYWLSDGYGYYCRPSFDSTNKLLKAIAQEILGSDKKANTIMVILDNYEDYLSDGYGYYCLPKYANVKMLLTIIAEEIIEYIR